MLSFNFSMIIRCLVALLLRMGHSDLKIDYYLTDPQDF